MKKHRRFSNLNIILMLSFLAIIAGIIYDTAKTHKYLLKQKFEADIYTSIFKYDPLPPKEAFWFLDEYLNARNIISGKEKHTSFICYKKMQPQGDEGLVFFEAWHDEESVSSRYLIVLLKNERVILLRGDTATHTKEDLWTPEIAKRIRIESVRVWPGEGGIEIQVSPELVKKSILTLILIVATIVWGIIFTWKKLLKADFENGGPEHKKEKEEQEQKKSLSKQGEP